MMKLHVPVSRKAELVSELNIILFCSVFSNPLLPLTLASHLSRYPTKSSRSHCNKNQNKFYRIFMTLTTLSLKSSDERKGCLNLFLVSFPASSEDTFTQSKNLSNICTNSIVLSS